MFYVKCHTSMHSHLCKAITGGGGGRGHVAQYLKNYEYGSRTARDECPVDACDEAGESSINWKLEEVYRRGTETVQPDAGGVQRVDSVQQAGTTLQGNSPQVTGKKRTVYDAVVVFFLFVLLD
jgi:hypothetical protein